MTTTDAWANAFIESSFRDAPDQDYIAARAAYRMDLTHAFWWPSLHAVEQYTKALLLYNRRPTSLVWKNFWFGARRRHVIKSFPTRLAWTRPVTFMRPEVYFALKDLVLFEKDVREHFEPGSTTKGQGSKKGTA